MNEPADPKSAPETSRKPSLDGLRTGLLMAGSALLGGLAVVLWNRKSLASLRQPAAPPNRPPEIQDEETE